MPNLRAPDVKGNNNEIQFKPGDASSYAQAFNRFYDPLCFFANRFMQNRQVAEDIVSDVFTKLWTSEGQYENCNSLKAWLYKSTRNACLNKIKRLDVNNRRLQKMPLEDTSYEMENSWVVEAEVLGKLQEAIESLPKGCKKIFQLHLGGYGNASIADLLNISIHTVKNQKARAIYLLRKRLKTQDIFVMMLLLKKILN